MYCGRVGSLPLFGGFPRYLLLFATGGALRLRLGNCRATPFVLRRVRGRKVISQTRRLLHGGAPRPRAGQPTDERLTPPPSSSSNRAARLRRSIACSDSTRVPQPSAEILVVARADRRQHVADWRTNHRVGDVVEGSRLGVHDDNTRAGRLGEWNEASHRIHLETGPYCEQEIGVPRGARGGVDHLRDESLAE